MCLLQTVLSKYMMLQYTYICTIEQPWKTTQQLKCTTQYEELPNVKGLIGRSSVFSVILGPCLLTACHLRSTSGVHHLWWIQPALVHWLNITLIFMLLLLDL